MKATEKTQNTEKSGWGGGEIIKIKVTQNIIFPEAKRAVEIPFSKSTFAKIPKIPQNTKEN